MRVRLTVIRPPTLHWRGPLVGGAREAGANPARTRHCHRVKPSAVRSPSGRRPLELAHGLWEGADPVSRKPGDLPPAITHETPSRKGWLMSHRHVGLPAGALAILMALVVVTS